MDNFDERKSSTEEEERGTKSSIHAEFIASLEKHGSSARAWDAMASELGCEVDDVKVYAYSYLFKALVQDRSASIYNKFAGDIGDANPSVMASADDTKQSSWSYHKLILLDSLMTHDETLQGLELLRCERAK